MNCTDPNLWIGIVGLILGAIGIGYAVHVNRVQEQEKKYAIHEMTNVFSQLCHLEWWILHDPTACDRAALANRVISMMHSLRITLNTNARRYGGKLAEIKPFLEEEKAK